jgi:hypothetical protein
MAYLMNPKIRLLEVPDNKPCFTLIAKNGSNADVLIEASGDL